ncbi:hypothetical protein AHAS_Ahas13G0351800 [Arachis hypogaea]
MCTIGIISQDHVKLKSDTIADVIRPLIEADTSIKVKSIIAKVQSRFNYTVSYRKAWLAKQKSTLPMWLKTKTAYMPRSYIQMKNLPVYRESEKMIGIRVLHWIF